MDLKITTVWIVQVLEAVGDYRVISGIFVKRLYGRNHSTSGLEFVNRCNKRIPRKSEPRVIVVYVRDVYKHFNLSQNNQECTELSTGSIMEISPSRLPYIIKRETGTSKL